MSNSKQIYQLRFWIRDISPCIWRRILIKDSCTIADLHNIIQITMGWSDYYLNQFKIRGKSYGVYHDGGMNFADNPNHVGLLWNNPHFCRVNNKQIICNLNTKINK